MSLFGSQSSKYPKKWGDMSLEFKLMFVYHGTMMFLFLVGGALSVHQQGLVAGGLILVMLVILTCPRFLYQS